MRRTAWALVAAGLAVGVIAPAALGEVAGSYADRFDQSSFAGSNGTFAWAGPWAEIGESDGAGSGAVRVTVDSACASGSCLKIASALLALDQAGAARFADTSVFSSADLSFEIISETLGLGGLVGALTGASFTVEVSMNGGSKWTVLERGNLVDVLNSETRKVLSLDSYLSPDFGIRFLVSDLLGGEVMIDDVQIIGVVVPPPTTTTTTTSLPPMTTEDPPGSTPTTSPASGTPSPPTTAARTTTTTRPVREEVTTTTSPESGPALVDRGSPPSLGVGLRMSDGGLQASADLPSFRPIALAGGHRSGVERIGSGWISYVSLALVISGLSLLGVDRRRRGESSAYSQ